MWPFSNQKDYEFRNELKKTLLKQDRWRTLKFISLLDLDSGRKNDSHASNTELIVSELSLTISSEAKPPPPVHVSSARLLSAARAIYDIVVFLPGSMDRPPPGRHLCSNVSIPLHITETYRYTSSNTYVSRCRASIFHLTAGEPVFSIMFARRALSNLFPRRYLIDWFGSSGSK